MSQVSPRELWSTWTASDLVDRFGAIPLSRVRHDPAPGTAREEDVLRIHDSEDRLYELVDQTMLEKTVGTYESYLAMLLARLLGNFVADHDLGIVLGADGMLRLAPGLIRIPDVSFISWARLPNRRIPDDPIAALVPDLAIEVVSRGNTQQEMDRKLREYLEAGVQLVWYVHPRQREAQIWSGPDNGVVVSGAQKLTGGTVLPGFSLALSELFTPERPAEPERRAASGE